MALLEDPTASFSLADQAGGGTAPPPPAPAPTTGLIPDPTAGMSIGEEAPRESEYTKSGQKVSWTDEGEALAASGYTSLAQMYSGFASHSTDPKSVEYWQSKADQAHYDEKQTTASLSPGAREGLAGPWLKSPLLQTAQMVPGIAEVAIPGAIATALTGGTALAPYAIGATTGLVMGEQQRGADVDTATQQIINTPTDELMQIPAFQKLTETMSVDDAKEQFAHDNTGNMAWKSQALGTIIGAISPAAEVFGGGLTKMATGALSKVIAPKIATSKLAQIGLHGIEGWATLGAQGAGSTYLTGEAEHEAGTRGPVTGSEILAGGLEQGNTGFGMGLIGGVFAKAHGSPVDYRKPVEEKGIPSGPGKGPPAAPPIIDDTTAAATGPDKSAVKPPDEVTHGVTEPPKPGDKPQDPSVVQPDVVKPDEVVPTPPPDGTGAPPAGDTTEPVVPPPDTTGKPPTDAPTPPADATPGEPPPAKPPEPASPPPEPPPEPPKPPTDTATPEPPKPETPAGGTGAGPAEPPKGDTSGPAPNEPQTEPVKPPKPDDLTPEGKPPPADTTPEPDEAAEEKEAQRRHEERLDAIRKENAKPITTDEYSKLDRLGYTQDEIKNMLPYVGRKLIDNNMRLPETNRDVAKDHIRHIVDAKDLHREITDLSNRQPVGRDERQLVDEGLYGHLKDLSDDIDTRTKAVNELHQFDADEKQAVKNRADAKAKEIAADNIPLDREERLQLKKLGYSYGETYGMTPSRARRLLADNISLPRADRDRAKQIIRHLITAEDTHKYLTDLQGRRAIGKEERDDKANSGSNLKAIKSDIDATRKDISDLHERDKNEARNYKKPPGKDILSEAEREERLRDRYFNNLKAKPKTIKGQKKVTVTVNNGKGLVTGTVNIEEHLKAKDALARDFNINEYDPDMHPMIKRLYDAIVRVAGNIPVYFVKQDELKKIDHHTAYGFYDANYDFIMINTDKYHPETIFHELYHGATEHALLHDPVLRRKSWMI